MIGGWISDHTGDRELVVVVVLGVVFTVALYPLINLPTGG